MLDTKISFWFEKNIASKRTNFEPFFASGPRMGRIVGFLEAFCGDVGVDLRGGQMRVAQQFLHTPQIGPRVEQVGGVAVAEFVRRQMRSNPAIAKYCFNRRDSCTACSGARRVVSEKNTGDAPASVWPRASQ